jgi:aminopeptidase N
MTYKTLLILLLPFAVFSQKFSHADSLRGTLSPSRACFDVLHYDLHVAVNPAEKSIAGTNNIRFITTQKTSEIQLDLFANLIIDEIRWANKKVNFRRDGNAIFIQAGKEIPAKQVQTVWVKYHGLPRPAVKPPWDGGFSWTKDPKGNPWVTVSCEGLGASVWWPCKDHPSDEPASMDIRIEGPKGLVSVSNGNLIEKISKTSTDEYHWKVSYPINLYNVSINMADYAHWSKTIRQLNGKDLNLDYYVLKENENVAKKHFEQSEEMLRIFEKYFGPYPFPKDGYALVETDYWGMEHQSAVAYGNHYKNNKFGFDFIIVHESAHEWFGNSISCSDHADLWIHEALGTYAEAIYVEEKLGKAKAQEYLNGQKRNIRNAFPIAGPYQVNYQHPDSDMYFKGTWMFHTLRNIIQDDALWFKTMREFCLAFYHKNTNTKEVVEFWSKHLNKPVKELMLNYLYQVKNPNLQYSVQQTGNTWTLRYRWSNLNDDISFPLTLKTGEKFKPNSAWQEIKLEHAPELDEESYLFDKELLK